MAERTVYVDDLDGSVLADEDHEEVLLGYKGITYKLDLSDKNVGQLDKALKPYIEAAQRLSGGRGRPKGSSSRSTSSASSDMSKEQKQAVRHWANTNGFTVSKRGRISAEVVEAFEAAQATATTSGKNPPSDVDH